MYLIINSLALIYFCFIDYAKAFDCVDHKKMWEILKVMGIPYHLTCLLKTCMQVKKQQLDLDMEQQTGSRSGKEYIKAVYCHPAYLTYMESIMQNTGLDEAHAGIKISGRNINNLRYIDDTTPMAESEEELKSLLMKMKEESVKAGLKLNIQKTKIMTSGPITSWQISSIQFSLSVVSDSLKSHGLQYARPPCPLPTPGVYSNSCPLSW